ncbi:hypothetical protein JHL22_04480 [Advenella sp. WQ 585]|uniref:Lipoprotein n=1 Tax=Advenella mandrilli TaxID=2800330 RepID=A0ABS1EDS7_9BURK|nr:hypothetical protein [Advenella mandrilli]MBK1780465.1 hypothetical protein [Advenella mandrilli]
MRTLTHHFAGALLGFFMMVTTSHAQEQAYPQYEKEKAIVFCMTREYVLLYQEEPAEVDLFPVCESRFATLETRIPYDNYKAVRDKGYMLYKDKQSAELLEKYYSILMGNQ